MTKINTNNNIIKEEALLRVEAIYWRGKRKWRLNK
jgi:hypothetical protein